MQKDKQVNSEAVLLLHSQYSTAQAMRGDRTTLLKPEDYNFIAEKKPIGAFCFLVPFLIMCL